MEVGIWNFNMKWKRADEGGSMEEYSQRVANVAHKAALTDLERGHLGDLFAIVEAFYSHPGWWDKEHVPEKIVCTHGGGSAFTPECFGRGWRSSTNTTAPSVGDPTGQAGDAGFFVNGDSFTLVEGSVRRSKIGPGGWGNTRYRITGARFRHRPSGMILPFYVTHLSTKGAGRPRQEDSCHDIIDRVRDTWWIPGDLPPIVVGDFNFGRLEDDGSESTPWPVMNEHFVEVGDLAGHQVIEHFWVGRISSFSDAVGPLEPIVGSYELNPEFNDGATTLTDHPAPYVRISLLVPVTDGCLEAIAAHAILLQ